MATTKIWPIKSGANIQVVINYITNPDKTTVREYILEVNNPNRSFSGEEKESMTDVLEYVMKDTATEERRYVSGVNVSPESARMEMMTTKEHYGKTDGIILWHGYQSFKPGEVTPEEAHRIGVELAEKLWGDYEVVISTHLDKAHIHNHFVINSVSFQTGKKLDAKWQEMKRESDRLCRLYGKSVIASPEYKGQHYSEYIAEKEGRYTWKSAIKKEVDEIIACSFDMEDFFSGLKEKGYRIKIGKYLTLQPRGKERGMRIDRILGPDYSVDGIEARISKNVAEGKVHIPQTKKYVCRQKLKPPGYKIKGLHALYIVYCYKLGVFEKRGIKSRSDYIYREELRNIHKITKETLFLARNKIENISDLGLVESRLKNELAGLTEKRNRLKEGKEEINIKIKEKRKELWLCRDIRERSRTMEDRRERNRQIDEKEKEVY